MLFSLLLLPLLLAGCGDSDGDELRRWMAEQRSQARPRIVPITEPKRFSPQEYVGASIAEPFSDQKLAAALRRAATQPQANGALIAPEMSRRKEPLEEFPLDLMTMVGTLARGGQPVALVQVEGLLYQVRPGNHLGQNYGRVLRVNETEIVLREIVQDAVGEWVERAATLQLQEKSK